MIAVILCGGSGTRLWPLSRKNFPKQFLKLYSDKSLLQETYLRMQKVLPAEDIYLVTNLENYYNVFNQLKEVCPSMDKSRIIVEPASLNTAPAIMLAIRHLIEKRGVGEEVPFAFLPADHYIGQPDKFAATLKAALENVGENIGTLGITPTGPETGFGYIEKGEDRGAYHAARSFKEKPDRKTAEEYLRSGRYVWNGGVYLFTARTFREELEKYAPELSAHFNRPYAEFLEGFSALPAQPIDTAISEKSDRVVVFEGDFGWSDIGSFDALAELVGADREAGKKHLFFDAPNVFARSESGKTIAVLGLSDVVVVESSDVVFVQKKGRSEDVKKLVGYLKENGRRELEHNLVVYRPWGKYEVLIDGVSGHKVKKITVYPGAALSQQSHERRSEHWVVVRGTAGVINGDREMTLKENESTYIPARAIHRLSNPGEGNLEIIEVQTGDYLEEDDIVRYQDEYGRTEK